MHEQDSDHKRNLVCIYNNIAPNTHKPETDFMHSLRT